MDDVEERLQRLTVDAGEAPAVSSIMTRSRHRRVRRHLVIAGLLLVGALGSGALAVAQSSTGGSHDVRADGSAAEETPTTTDSGFRQVRSTLQAEPDQLLAISVLEGDFMSIPTSGRYEIAIQVTTPPGVDGDLRVSRWSITNEAAEGAIGNSESCQDALVCNEPWVVIEPDSDARTIVSLFFDNSKLRVGSTAATAVLMLSDGTELRLDMVIESVEVEAPPLRGTVEAEPGN